MTDYTETQNYLDLAAQSNDQWFKDRALRRASEELTAARDEAERLRVQEDSLWETFEKIADFLGIDCEAARNIPGKPSNVFKAAIIRSQADAIDAVKSRCDEEGSIVCGGDFLEEAQRLRQQADEAEQ